RNLPEKALCTPEAAESEHRGFEPFRMRPLQRTVEDMMRGGGGNGPLASGQRFFRRGQVQFLVQQIAEEEHHDSFPAAAPSGDGDAGSLTLALVAYKVKEQREAGENRKARLIEDGVDHAVPNHGLDLAAHKSLGCGKRIG